MYFYNFEIYVQLRLRSNVLNGDLETDFETENFQISLVMFHVIKNIWKFKVMVVQS